MKVCRTCGSTFKECVDFCFYDGEVLVAEGAAAVSDSEPATALDAPVPPDRGPSQGPQADYTESPQPAPVSQGDQPLEAPVEVAAAEAEAPGDAADAPPVPTQAASPAEAPTVPADEELAEADTIDLAQPPPVTATPSPSELSTAETPVPAPAASAPPPTSPPPVAAATPIGDQVAADPSEETPFPSVPDVLPDDLEAPVHDDEDTLPPLPPAPIQQTPAKPQERPTPTPRPAVPPRAMTFEAEEDAGDRGSMIAVGAVALFLGMVFIIGAGVAALTMGGSALLEPSTDDVANAPEPAPTLAPTRGSPPRNAPDPFGTLEATTDAGATDAGTTDAASIEGTEPVPEPPAEPAPPAPPVAAQPAVPTPVPPAPAPTAPQPVVPTPVPAPQPSNDGAAVNDVVRPPASRGIVSFSSTPPGATLSIEGRGWGKTPADVDLTYGSHDFKLELDGHQTYNGSVNVRSARMEQPVATLTPVATATPPAPAPAAPAPAEPVFVEKLVFLQGAIKGELFVDGVRIGPLTEPVSLPMGRHLYEVQCKGQAVFRAPHEIGSGDPKVLQLHTLTDDVTEPVDMELRKSLCGV